MPQHPQGAISVSHFSSTEPDYADALAIRMRVFVDEQQVPRDEELDEWEDSTIHFLLRVAGAPAATGRVRVAEDGYGKLERIATLPEFRGKGLGRVLMDAMMEHLSAQGVTKFKLSSQLRSRGFYEALGFSAPADAPVYMDANIPHVMLYKC